MKIELFEEIDDRNSGLLNLIEAEGLKKIHQKISVPIPTYTLSWKTDYEKRRGTRFINGQYNTNGNSITLLPFSLYSEGDISEEIMNSFHNMLSKKDLAEKLNQCKIDSSVATFIHEIGHLIHEHYFNNADMGLKKSNDKSSSKNILEKFAYAFEHYILDDGETSDCNMKRMGQLLNSIRDTNESLNEEFLNNKTYIFRGESNNKYQKNYHNRSNDGLKSRYFSWEAFDGIYMFGNVVVYELLDESNILFYDDSSEEFCHEYNLMDEEYHLLYRRYGVKCLNEIDCADFETERPSVKLDRHDAYHAFQLVATLYLEADKRYSGCSWYEYMDDPEAQLQIWDDSIIRRLSYKEAKGVCSELAKENPDVYAFGNKSMWDNKFNLHR